MVCVNLRLEDYYFCIYLYFVMFFVQIGVIVRVTCLYVPHTHAIVTCLTHFLGLYTKAYVSIGLEGTSGIVNEGLDAHLIVVELLLRLLPISCVSHIEMAFSLLMVDSLAGSLCV